MFLQVLKIIAAILTALTGLLSLVAPRSVQGFTGLKADGPRGISEIRAVLGGLFLALGVLPVLLNEPLAYRMLGGGYLTVAAARAFSIVFDRSYASSNLISLGVEVVLGVLLVV